MSRHLVVIVFIVSIGAAGAAWTARASGEDKPGSAAPSPSSGIQPITTNTVTLAEGHERPRARVEEVAWLAGWWEGEGLGGRCEEAWSEPRAGAMMGMFRAVGDNGVMFYEFFTISEVGGTLELRLKHFNRDVTGWEEKDEVATSPLVKLEENAVYFEGLTYRRSGDRLEAYVVMSKKDGSKQELGFSYSRK